MANKNWIDQAQGAFLEDLNKYRNILGDEYSSSRRSVVNSLYNQGLRTGGVAKGTGELNRTFNENIAKLNRDEATKLTQGQEAQAGLNIQSELDTLTRAYQVALENATKMRRGAEQQMFDTGAGNEAAKYETEAKNIKNTINSKYAELQRMSLLNPYIGQTVAGAPAAANQFNTAAAEGEKNISSGKTVWGDISSAVLPVIANAILPGVGSALGLGEVGAQASALLSKIPGAGQIGDLYNKLAIPGGAGSEMLTNFLTNKKPEDYFKSKLMESHQAEVIRGLQAKGYEVKYGVNKDTGQLEPVSAEKKAVQLPAITYTKAIEQGIVHKEDIGLPSSEELIPEKTYTDKNGMTYKALNVDKMNGLQLVKFENPNNLKVMNSADISKLGGYKIVPGGTPNAFVNGKEVTVARITTPAEDRAAKASQVALGNEADKEFQKEIEATYGVEKLAGKLPDAVSAITRFSQDATKFKWTDSQQRNAGVVLYNMYKNEKTDAANTAALKVLADIITKKQGK